MRSELPTAIRGFYGEKYTKNRYTSLALGLVAGLGVVSMLLLLVVQPAQGTPVRHWAAGCLAMAGGSAVFLYLVVETWQTRRLIRFKGCPAIDYDKSPRLYATTLVAFALVAATMFLVGLGVVVQWPEAIHSIVR